jgi:hypothetical protein
MAALEIAPAGAGEQSGVASTFCDKVTATGGMDCSAQVAASPDLPFGTMVTVVHNGQSEIVKIIDRPGGLDTSRDRSQHRSGARDFSGWARYRVADMGCECGHTAPALCRAHCVAVRRAGGVGRPASRNRSRSGSSLAASATVFADDVAKSTVRSRPFLSVAVTCPRIPRSQPSRSPEVSCTVAFRRMIKRDRGTYQHNPGDSRQDTSSGYSRPAETNQAQPFQFVPLTRRSLVHRFPSSAVVRNHRSDPAPGEGTQRGLPTTSSPPCVHSCP